MVKIFSPAFFGLTQDRLPCEEKCFDLEGTLEKKFQPIFPGKRIGATPLESLAKKIILTVSCYFLMIISFGLILKSEQFETSFLLLKKNMQIYINPTAKALESREKPKAQAPVLEPIDEEWGEADLSAISHHSRSSVLNVHGQELDEGSLSGEEADDLSPGFERFALQKSLNHHRLMVSGSPTVLPILGDEAYELRLVAGRHPTPSPIKHHLMVSQSPTVLPLERGINDYSPIPNLQSSPVHLLSEEFPRYGQVLREPFVINYQNTFFKTMLMRFYHLPQDGKVSKETLKDDIYSKLLLLQNLSTLYSELSPSFMIHLKTFFVKGSALALYNEENLKHWKKISVNRFNDLISNPAFQPSEKDLIAMGEIITSETKFVEISRFITDELKPSFLDCQPHLFDKITENTRFFTDIEHLKERQAFFSKPELTREIGSKTLDFLRKVHAKEHFFAKFFEIFFTYKNFIGEDMSGHPTQVTWIKLLAVGQFIKACSKL